MKKWHHFCAHAQWWSPWRGKFFKCPKKTPRFVELNFFTNRNRRKRFSQNERRRANICLRIGLAVKLWVAKNKKSVHWILWKALQLGWALFRWEDYNFVKGRSTNLCLKILIFALGLGYDLSKFSDDFTPFFQLSRTITKSLGKNKNLRQCFVARSTLNKCAKFHGDSQSGKKIKFNLTRAIELSETPDFVATLYRNPIQASNFAGTFDQLFLWINFLMQFSHKMPLFFFYTMVQKSQKMTKSSKQGGFRLKPHIKVHFKWM